MALTETQVDFILEMYALDHPDEYKFYRPGHVEVPPTSEILAAWEERMSGTGYSQFWEKALPSPAVLKRVAEMSNAASFLKRASDNKPEPVDEKPNADDQHKR